MKLVFASLMLLSWNTGDGLVELLAISLLHGVGANWHLD